MYIELTIVALQGQPVLLAFRETKRTSGVIAYFYRANRAAEDNLPACWPTTRDAVKALADRVAMFVRWASLASEASSLARESKQEILWPPRATLTKHFQSK
jgi:hypothetical protein